MRLTPFLLFDGNCAEAMALYQDVFGGELTLQRAGDMPNRAQIPPSLHTRVVHAHLKSGLVEFSATDWMHPTRKPHMGNTVAMYLNQGTYEELTRVFDKLAAGADRELLDALRDMPFGTYGHLADKYGVHWFFQGTSKSR